MKQNEIFKEINVSVKSKDTYWQTIRGICIIAVILGHSRGGWNYEQWQYNDTVTSFNYQYWIVFYQIIKCVVGVFIMITGYFINQQFANTNPLQFYISKIKRLVVPFLIWSTAYTVYAIVSKGGNFTADKISDLLLGKDGIQLYFIVVLIQLFILTPIFARYTDSKILPITAFVATVGYSVFCQYWQLTERATRSYEMYYFVNWIFFFCLGMYIRKNPDFLHKIKTKIAVVAFFVLLALNIAHGYIMQYITDSPLVMVSQVSVINALYIATVCILIFKIKHFFNSKSDIGILIYLGDISFGIYFMHWLIMFPLRRFLEQYSIIVSFLPFAQLFETGIILLSCVAIIQISKKVLGDKVIYLGF